MDKAYAEHWDLLHEVLKKHIREGDLKYSAHAIQRMTERNISRESIERILALHPPHEMFRPREYPYGEKPFANPDPVFSVLGKDDGIVVAVALQKKYGIRFVVVTVYRVTEDSRHKR